MAVRVSYDLPETVDYHGMAALAKRDSTLYLAHEIGPEDADGEVPVVQRLEYEKDRLAAVTHEIADDDLAALGSGLLPKQVDRLLGGQRATRAVRPTRQVGNQLVTFIENAHMAETEGS